MSLHLFTYTMGVLIVGYVVITTRFFLLTPKQYRISYLKDTPMIWFRALIFGANVYLTVFVIMKCFMKFKGT